MEIPLSILKKMNERRDANAFRSLRMHKSGVDFYSNDYLGIAKIEEPLAGAHGATGSRLISGNFEIAETFENECAAFFKQEAALLYNSGYTANLGVFSALPQRGETVIYDEFCHASIRDGIRLGTAKNVRFKHNDLADLDYRLSKADGITYVVVEAVYSMDGDQAPLAAIAQLCQKHEAYLIVDEAHAAGIFGEHGEGLVSQLELDDAVFLKIVTFGKAYGSHGAVVLTKNSIRDFLVNFSRPLIYTTALPPIAVLRLQQVLKKVKNTITVRQKLNHLIQYFKEKTAQHKLTCLSSNSPIQGVVIVGNTQVKEKAELLIKNRILVKAILSPTVPNGKERIRICLHSYNTTSEIDQLIELLK